LEITSLIKMRAAFTYLSDGRRSIGVETEDRWIDVYTNETIPEPETTFPLEHYPYTPVAVWTVTGVILAQMMDEAWPGKLDMSGPDQSEARITNVISLNNGMIRPLNLLEQLVEIFQRGGSWSEVKYKVTLYWDNDESCAYMGVDNQFYDALTGQLIGDAGYETLILIPLFHNRRPYLIIEDQSEVIVVPDPHGKIDYSLRTGVSDTISNILIMYYPRNLLPEHDSLELIKVNYAFIFEHRISVLMDYSQSFDDYNSLLVKKRYWFNFNSPIPFDPDTLLDIYGNPVTLSDNIRELFADNASVIYNLDNGYSVSAGSVNRKPYEVDRVITTQLNGSGIITRVFSLISEGEAILREIQRRIRKRETDENLAIPERKYLINQKVLEELIIRLYGAKPSDPVILGGYTRINYQRYLTLLRLDRIKESKINPLFQPFAGTPGTPNRILTITTKTGERFFTKISI